MANMIVSSQAERASLVHWFRVLSIENEVMFPGGVSKSIFMGVAEPGVSVVEPGPL